MTQYTNLSKIPLSVAVFLATDYYDYIPGTFSATGLLKPIRQSILAERLSPEQRVVDIAKLASSRMGTAYHDGIEKAWKTNHVKAMQRLGYSDELIARIRINPEPGTLRPNEIPVYMEQRIFRDFHGYKLSGKPDFIGAGRLEDFKSTSVYSYLNGRNDWKYRMQGSIYRWLDPQLITKDVIAIQFLFTDWQRGMAKADPKYPQQRTLHKVFPLFSLEETEAFIKQQLSQYRQYREAPEHVLPPCSDDELWRRPTVWKYFKNPTAKRATKNFENLAQARAYKAKEGGGTGEIREFPGEVQACHYCPAYELCTQKDRLLATGELKLD